MMRVITGKAKGVRLDAPKGETTRPTSERAKEAIFSMIQFETDSRVVLDLFAGSGQLGIEALSRGAKKAVFVDQSKEAIEIIRKNLARTRFQEVSDVYNCDSDTYLQRSRDCFDLVILDPPYAKKVIPDILKKLITSGMVAAGALVICETEQLSDVFGEDRQLENRFSIRRQVHYGVAHITLMETV